MSWGGRLTSGRAVCLAAWLVVGLAGCQPAGQEAVDETVEEGAENGMQSPSATEDGLDLEAQAAAAVAHLGERLGVGAGEIEILEARRVTWPDAAAGCPRPGMVYMQVLTPGALVRLRAEGREYRYHARDRSLPLLCPAERAEDPLPESSTR